MLTELDLTDALSAEARDSRDLADARRALAARLQQPVRTGRPLARPLLASLAIAATVAIVVAAVTSAGSHHTSVASPSASTRPSNSSSPTATLANAMTVANFTATALPDGLTVVDDYHATGGTYEQLILGTAADPAAVTVYILSDSVRRPAIPPDATAVSINGRPGYASSVLDMTGRPDAQPNDPKTAPGILWRDAAGHWVFLIRPVGFVSPVALTSTQLLDAANALHVGTPQPVKVPVKLGYLPPGSTVRNVDIATAGVTLEFGSLNLTIEPGNLVDHSAPAEIGATVTPISVNGFTGSWSNSTYFPYAAASDGRVTVSFIDSSQTAPQPVPLEVMKQILSALTVTSSSLLNTTGWFDLSSAVPQ